MDIFGEAWITRHVDYFSDPEAGPDALLNDATEWLHYAHNAIRLLAELGDGHGSMNTPRLRVMLESIAAFIEMGTRCATQAHLRMQLFQVRSEECSITDDERDAS
ncbi:hypothetical protein ISN75_22685 [Dyella marensis]|uniref:hypothetical protein n=1 Tax=Dyella marensis TaxID=500610 RepID=UPI0031D811D5